jgi:predicted DNA-binding transcriptional regulator AlpA
MSSNGCQGQRADALPLALPSDGLKALLERLRGLPPGSLVPVAWVLGELEPMVAPVSAMATSDSVKPSLADRLLTPEEVAACLRVTSTWVYSHWRQRLPFGRKLGHRTLRFSSRALERHLAMGRGAA